MYGEVMNIRRKMAQIYTSVSSLRICPIRIMVE